MSKQVQVLIIEDDAVLLSAYQTVLELEGYGTLTAGDGVEGLQQAQQYDPQVILLDMQMPNMNGIDFLREYNVPKNHPDTKIIVFSNMSVPSDVKLARDLGAAKYLTKSSFTPKEIEEIIQEVLKGE